VERSHRIDSEEFYRLLEGQVIDDTNLFTSRLQEWEAACPEFLRAKPANHVTESGLRGVEQESAFLPRGLLSH
jgi:hypothetical protein